MDLRLTKYVVAVLVLQEVHQPAVLTDHVDVVDDVHHHLMLQFHRPMRETLLHDVTCKLVLCKCHQVLLDIAHDAVFIVWEAMFNHVLNNVVAILIVDKIVNSVQLGEKCSLDGRT